MYCNKCGNYFEGDSRICPNCQKAETEASFNKSTDYSTTESTNAYTMSANNTALPDPNNRMFGFAKALTSTILGFIGFVWFYISLIIAAFDGATGFVLLFLGAVTFVLPIIFGAISIKTFKDRKDTCVKPIPTLVLGIVGLAWGSLAAFFAFLTFIISCGTV